MAFQLKHSYEWYSGLMCVYKIFKENPLGGDFFFDIYCFRNLFGRTTKLTRNQWQRILVWHPNFKDRFQTDYTNLDVSLVLFKKN
jgi:hypothetical protein